jgi:hypothetical protein
VACSQASGTEAKASLTSNRSMSSIFMPAFFSARWVAGSGASSMITGSWPITRHVVDARQRRDAERLQALSLTTMTPEAPSQIWLAVAAVSVPPSCSSLTPQCPRAWRRSGCLRRRRVHVGCCRRRA